jgi:hypothetical protein
MSNLKTQVRAMLRDLRAIGFGDDSASINGGDAVNTITGHFYELEDEVGEAGATPTNVDFIADMMESSRQGPIVQMFIMDALTKYSAMMAKMTPKELEKDGKWGFIAPQAWIDAAKEVNEKMEARLK